jgi:hypothetical protein
MTAAASVFLALTACETTPEPEPRPDVKRPPEPVAREFEPAFPVAGIRHLEGQYPTLLSPESYAVWVTPRVAAEKQAAAEATEPIDPLLVQDALEVSSYFVVVELHIESVFNDPSIAYDAVGLRNFDVYMLLPDGRRVAPVQRIPGDLSEAQRNALTQFRRTNILLFPRRDLWLGQQTLEPDFPSVRLVLSSTNGDFGFEWPEENFADPGRLPPGPDPRRLQTGFRDLFEKARRAAHVFD